MKIALVFACDASVGVALAAYRSERFIGALVAQGYEPIVIDVDSGTATGRLPVPAYDGAPTTFFCTPPGLRRILQQERPALIQTFGAASRHGWVWTRLAQAGVRSCILSPRTGRSKRTSVILSLAWTRIRPGLRSFTGWSSRLASRHVDGLIGSNRADLGQHLELGFFPRATFSMVAPPPLAMAATEAAGAAPTATPTPTFGVYDPGATAASLGFVFHAIDLTGHPEFFRFVVAPARLRALASSVPPCVAFVEAGDAAAFVRSIDVLVLPYAADRMMESAVAALRARKIVIAPDGGGAAELIEYGRHGVLYAAGSAYHLAMAINVMTQSWQNRPFDFQGVDEVIAKSAPVEVAATFAAAYRRVAA